MLSGCLLVLFSPFFFLYYYSFDFFYHLLLFLTFPVRAFLLLVFSLASFFAYTSLFAPYSSTTSFLHQQLNFLLFLSIFVFTFLSFYLSLSPFVSVVYLLSICLLARLSASISCLRSFGAEKGEREKKILKKEKNSEKNWKKGFGWRNAILSCSCRRFWRCCCRCC